MSATPSNSSAALLDPVRADAAARAGVPAAAVEVVSIRGVQWPDGSLGCPEPGMIYTQAIVDGWQAIVRAGGRDFDYRITGPGRFRLCENPS